MDYLRLDSWWPQSNIVRWVKDKRNKSLDRLRRDACASPNLTEDDAVKSLVGGLCTHMTGFLHLGSVSREQEKTI